MKSTIISTVLLSAALCGCGNFLEPKSDNEFTPKEASSLNELLLGEAYPRSDTEYLNTFMCLLDDDVEASPYQEKNVGVDMNKYLAPYSWQSNMCDMMKEAYARGYDLYKTYYGLILGANAVIDYLPTVTGSPEELALVEAQAYTLRAFYYFHLVNMYGAPYSSNPQAPGVPLKLNSGMELDRDLSRNTVAEVYEVILSDLLHAESLYQSVPEASQWKANYRTSLPLVQLLLSRTYLFMENWEQAALYAKKVMGNSHFQLYDLRTLVTDEENDEIVPFNFHSYKISNENIWLYGDVSNMTKWVYNNNEGVKNYPLFMASKELMNSFEKGDLRKSGYIPRCTTKIENADGEYESLPYAFGKVNLGSRQQPLGGNIIFGRSFRVSEAYLNYCEAEAMMAKEGNAAAKQEAESTLNKFRRYRIMDSEYKEKSFTNVDELIEFIHNERRREFCFEDFRWYDLRRWGMPEIKHVWYSDATTRLVYTLKANDLGYTLPLPDDALEENPKLEQNPLAPAPRVGE